MNTLDIEFFDRDPVTICKELLGKFLVIKQKGAAKRYIITEVEAYDGEEDEACHARHGKTERNAPMYSAPGCWYVYLVYGMYYMLNIVTGPGNHPSAILIRGLKSSILKDTSSFSKGGQNLKLNGPGKVTKGLGIDKSFNGKIANEKTDLRIEESGIKIPKIHTSPRIGIDYAGDTWKNKLWRFYID